MSFLDDDDDDGDVADFLYIAAAVSSLAVSRVDEFKSGFRKAMSGGGGSGDGEYGWH